MFIIYSQIEEKHNNISCFINIRYLAEQHDYRDIINNSAKTMYDLFIFYFFFRRQSFKVESIEHISLIIVLILTRYNNSKYYYYHLITMFNTFQKSLRSISNY